MLFVSFIDFTRRHYSLHFSYLLLILILQMRLKTQVGNVMFYENLLNCIIYHYYIINDIWFAVFAVYKLCIQIKLLIKLVWCIIHVCNYRIFMWNEFEAFKINFVCPSQISSMKPTKFLCAFILFFALWTNNLVSKMIMEKAWERTVLCRGAA